MSEGVEWTIHACTVLATLPDDQAMPAAKLAEFHGVAPAYLAKHLQAITAAEIAVSVPGPRGGYRLARPPAEITLLHVVQAVDGADTAFRCTEIRQQGPTSGPPSSYRQRCGIATAMWRAEDAWRAELSATTIADLVMDLFATVAPEQLAASAEWIQQVEIRRSRRRGEASQPTRSKQ